MELAEVRDPALVGNATLAALDLRDQTTTEPRALLLSYLRDKELLLVVDNCEHLLGAAALLVSDVLEAAPACGSSPPAGNRYRFRASTCCRSPRSSCLVPRPTSPWIGSARTRRSLLFTERASAASGTFELTASNRTAVVDLCRRLDGLPLAIELAAVRTRVLSPEQILDRLADRFALLTGGSRAALPRHQTLRTTIEWSHDLLGPDERTLLRRLCVFAGRFTLEDVESVCTSDDVPAARALDVLSSLVDKSLVTKEDVGGLACYRLHETMREFADLKLREAGEEDVLEERCTEYYVTRCRRSAEVARYELVEWLGMDGPGDRQHPVGPWAMPGSWATCHPEWISPRPSVGSGPRVRPPRASGGWMRSSRLDEVSRSPRLGLSTCADTSTCCWSIPPLPHPPSNAR